MSLSNSLCRSCRVFLFNSRRYCSGSVGGSAGGSVGGSLGGDHRDNAATSTQHATKPVVSVTHDAVQAHLARLTGMDFDKVFKQRREPLVLPKYQLLTEGELINLYKQTVKRAQERLKMVPMMEAREERGKEREKDERLNNFDDSKWLFVDISLDKPDKDRHIVVREPTGTLRDATWEETERVIQMYMPKTGKNIDPPVMLSEGHLPSVLARGFHLHVLEVTCSQHDPDSTDYIRVFKTVFEDADKRRLYDSLHSTKFYGTFVWYLVENHQIDDLLTHYITNKRFDDAEQLVRLYLLCYPATEIQSCDSNNEPLPGLEILEEYCQYRGQHKLVDIVAQEKKRVSDSEAELLSVSA